MKTRDPASALSRVERLLGPEAVHKLRQAHVTVCGLGAVGSFAVESLARSGVGHLLLVDFDVIKPSNINRQLFALHSTVGRPKIEVARERVADIQPACDVRVMNCFIDEQTSAEIVASQADVLIDAIDSVGPKTALIAAAVAAGIPVVSAMGAATRTDPALVRAADLADTERCPLARFMRKKLKKRGIDSGVRCIYSTEPPRNAPAEDEIDEERLVDRGRPRQPLGSMCSLPGIFGLTAAREALAIIVPGL